MAGNWTWSYGIISKGKGLTEWIGIICESGLYGTDKIRGYGETSDVGKRLVEEFMEFGNPRS